MKIKTVLFALLFVALSPVYGQSSLRIAADSSSGTYNKMLGEIVNLCATDEFSIAQASGVSGGAPGNLEALYNNRADAAFLHSDVFLYNSQADSSYNRFKTLVALYPEPIHVLVLRDSKTSKSGTFSFGKAQFNTLSDLTGYTVGAAGGGVYTSRILTGQGQGGFTVQPFDKGSDVIKALTDGTIAAAIFVGAQPLPNIEQLNKSQYKLIPIGETIASRVSNVYRTAKINYPGLTNGPIVTLAPVATLLTKNYSTPAKVAAQRNFRSCFNEKLAELQDSGSPNWQDVQANDHGVLNNWLDLPDGPTAVTRKR